jgi:UDPglucose 6-dehydrogenase
MRVAIIGSGHVGLVTAACLAKLGHDVLCVDSDPEVIELLKHGKVRFHEPGLSDLVSSMVAEGRLLTAETIEEAVPLSEVVFICVSTPPKANGAADLSYIEAATRAIAASMNGYHIIVEKSTVPAKTGERVQKTLRMHAKPKVDFDVVSFPEFSREGHAIDDFLRPDRLVLGVESERAERSMRELTRGIEAPVVVTDIASAELIKHASNCFLALKISYANALANVCEAIGANVQEVVHGMGLDERIGEEFLGAGVGYGGSCFPKDMAAFIAMSDELGYDFKMLKAAREVNEERPARLVEKLRQALWVLSGKTVAVLGLSFKPDTDDVREAPALALIRLLLEEGCSARAYDPVATATARKVLGERIVFCDDAYEAVTGADALVLVTEWDEFRHLDLNRLKGLLTLPVIIDGRNVFDPKTLSEAGFIYHGVGK